MSTKCYVNRKELLTALDSVSRFAPKRSPKPILSSVRVFLNGSVELSATDLECSAIAWCDHAESKTGIDALFCVSPVRLAMILKGSKDESICLEHDDEKNVLQLNTQNGTMELICQTNEKGKNAGEEFPEIARDGFEPVGTLDAGTLRDLISATVFATETESSRYALGGVLLEARKPETDLNEDSPNYQPAKFRAVGTDGRRMAVYGDRQFEANYTAIIPARFCQYLGKLLKGASQVAVSSAPNEIRFEVFYNGDRMPIIAISRLVEGRFPKWREVIPRRCDALLCYLEADRILPILKDAGPICTEESRGLDFVWTAGDLTISNKTADVGTFSRRYGTTAKCQKFGHAAEFDLTISLDVNFVRDWFESLKAQKLAGCVADFQNGDMAALFTADNGLSVSVIMPLARDRR